MGDRLEQCLCGSEAVKHNEGVVFHDKTIKGFRIYCNQCLQCTSLYETFDMAATAWQIMQRALKAGWTSEAPTEEGHWWFLGKVHVDGRDVWEFNSPVHVSIEKDLFTSCGQYCGHHLSQYKGIWCQANYPSPPKDSE